jgi:hypothetical protein
MPDSTTEPTQRSPKRLTDLLTAFALAAAGLVLLGASAPSLLRVAGLGEQREVARPLLEPTREKASPHDEGRFGFVPDDDESPLADQDRDPMHPPTPSGSKHVKAGLAKSLLTIVDEPADGATRIGLVQKGQVVMVLREEGAWALVAFGSYDVQTGWARRSEIAVR